MAFGEVDDEWVRNFVLRGDPQASAIVQMLLGRIKVGEEAALHAHKRILAIEKRLGTIEKALGLPTSEVPVAGDPLAALEYTRGLPDEPAPARISEAEAMMLAEAARRKFERAEDGHG